LYGMVLHTVCSSFVDCGDRLVPRNFIGIVGFSFMISKFPKLA